MKSIEVKGSLREAVGKSNAKNLRNKEEVPCVLYGKGQNVHFHVNEKVFKPLVFSPNAYLINFDIDGNKHQAVMRDVQFHPVSDKIIHADFYAVEDKSPVWMSVPVRLEGSSIGVLQGGRLVQKMRKIKVKALPNQLPDEVVIDITKLGIGKSVKVGSLVMKDVEFLDAANSVVVLIKTARGVQAVGEEAEAEGEEETETPAEGEAAAE